MRESVVRSPGFHDARAERSAQADIKYSRPWTAQSKPEEEKLSVDVVVCVWQTRGCGSGQGYGRRRSGRPGQRWGTDGG